MIPPSLLSSCWKKEESKIKIEILRMVLCKSWQHACKAVFVSILSSLGTKKSLVWENTQSKLINVKGLSL